MAVYSLTGNASSPFHAEPAHKSTILALFRAESLVENLSRRSVSTRQVNYRTCLTVEFL